MLPFVDMAVTNSELKFGGGFLGIGKTVDAEAQRQWLGGWLGAGVFLHIPIC